MVKWAAFVAVLAVCTSVNLPVEATSDKCSVKSSSPAAATTAPNTDVLPLGSEASLDSSAAGYSTPAPASSSPAEPAGTVAPASMDESAGSSSVTINIDPTIAYTSTVESTYTNWVGPNLGTGSVSACYREAHVMDTCPLGFDPALGTCWAQCPLAYPVECGMECIRQSDDCGLELVYKVTAVANAALTAATLGVFGKFSAAAKAVQTGVKCAIGMMGVMKNIVRYIRNIKTSDPQTSQDKLLALLYQTDNVVVHLPVSIMTCLGMEQPAKADFTSRVLVLAELTLMDVMTYSDEIVSNWDKFMSVLTSNNLTATIDELQDDDITDLKSALASNSTCGYNMKALTDKTWRKVEELREATPGISEDDMRVAMSNSDLVLNEIPIVTNNCMEELVAQSDEETAYETRDTLRKTFGVIVDDLVETGTSNNGSTLSAEEFALAASDKALIFVSLWDPTGIAGLVIEYLQPICGPSEMIGEIDDGTATEALALTTVGDAFNSSSGTWTKTGDGVVSIAFTSVDTEDVSVNIMSGGNEIANLDVAAEATVMWTSTVAELGGKTLYLDRWRPGFLGLPGTGGGSLKLWIPRAAEGGHLDLQAVLNES